MNYIGSKLSLIDFISNSINATLIDCGEHRPANRMMFADLFAGTGAVGTSFKEQGFNVIANDIQYYSYVLNKHFIGNNGNIKAERLEKYFDKLNSIDGTTGFIYNNYSLGGTKGREHERMYFSDSNSKKCDAIRQKLEELKNSNEIDEGEYFYLLACLVNAIDKVANTASVYGAYLKQLKKSAIQPLMLSPLKLIRGHGDYRVYNREINQLAKEIEGDILYLDPPYNARQYCSNYHILETVAKYDNPVISGKTGLREYSKQKSEFCSTRTVSSAFEKLVQNANFKYIFLSYNNEGLMREEEIKEIMGRYGEYRLFTQEYKRFKADKTENRNHKKIEIVESLHTLIKK